MSLMYVVSLVFGYGLAVFHGLSFVIRLFIRYATHPSTPFWSFRKRELPPQCLNDPKLGNHCYIQLKNVKLHYVEAGDRSKPLMLLIHGFPEFWYSWRHQLREFSSDYWVVAVDMRGYGDSEKPVGKENYKMDLLVADMRNLILALGKDRCTLVAHNWGGCIGWYLVLYEPHMFDCYIMMNSIHPDAFHQHLMKHYSQLRKSWYVFFYQLPWLPELWGRMYDFENVVDMMRGGSTKSPPTITDQDLEAYKFYLGKPGGFTPPIDYYRANFLLTAKETLQGLGKGSDFPPGLILFGDNDHFLDKEIQDITVEMITNSTLVYIKDANHFIQQDDPVAVNREMWKFLKKSSSRGKS